MTQSLNRREVLLGTGTIAAWAVLGMRRQALAAAPKAVIHETRVISHQPELFHGWPTLARRTSGELLLVYSGGRAGHVCPFGRVEMMRSHDEGKTWGWPRVILDTEIDDRDAGVLETAKGTLLVTTFTSLAYVEFLEDAEKNLPPKRGGWPANRLQHVLAAHNRLTEEQRKALLGVWMLRSTDGGLTWSAPYDCRVDTPHGPIQLSDGRLLYAGIDFYRSQRVGVCESADDGLTWRWLADIPLRSGDDLSLYEEPYPVECADGRILVQIRNANKNNRGETLQTESSDGGKTWTTPHAIGVWGLPSHMLKLRDGRLLMTYGHRRAPLGNQARLSSDNGQTWSEAIVLSSDGTNDLGYPSTAQLTDGSLLSVWYEWLKDTPQAALRQAHWSLETM